MSNRGEFSFVTLCDEGSVANVFVHGYSAGQDLEDRLALCNCIPAMSHGSTNVFAFWRAGHILDFRGSKSPYLGFLIRGNPILGTAGTLVADRIDHFRQSRKRANRAGKVFLRELGRYLKSHHPRITRVNLIGHSLGGRLLVSALEALPPCDTTLRKRSDTIAVNDVLLMAAAVELSGDSAIRIGARIEGELINAYSPDDGILLLNVDEKCAGRHPIASCRNEKMDGFGHTKYWPNLPQVLARTGISNFGEIGQLTSLAPRGHSKKSPMYARLLDHLCGVGDHLHGDTLLFDVLDHTTPETRAEIARHLNSSAWTSIDAAISASRLTRELQLLGGNALANRLRGRGLRYAGILQGLIVLFDLTDESQSCVRVSEVEQLLVREFFSRFWDQSHALAHCDRKTLLQMEPSECRRLAAELATKLTLRDTMKQGLPGIRSRLKAVMLPGHSSTIPVVLLLAHARVHLRNAGYL